MHCRETKLDLEYKLSIIDEVMQIRITHESPGWHTMTKMVGNSKIEKFMNAFESRIR